MFEHPATGTPDTPWYRDLLAWLVALGFAGYCLAGLAAAYLSIEDNRLSIAFVTGVVSLSTVVFCSNALRYGVKLPHIGIVVFLMLYTTRLVWDTGRATQSDSGYILLFYVTLVLVPLMALVVPLTPWRVSNVITCCFWISSIACIAALGLDAAGLAVDPLENDNRLEFDRLNPITLARAAALSLLSVLVGWSFWPLRWKYASLAVVPLSASVLFLTASRGPLLAFAFAAILYCAMKRHWVLLFTATAGLALVVGASPTIDGESIMKRLRVEAIERDESATSRLTYSDIAWQEFLENPVFGSGSELPGIGGYPHNVIVETAMAMGAPGLVLLLVLIAFTFLRSLRWIATGTGDPFTASLFLFELIATQSSGSLSGHTVLLITMGRILSFPPLEPGKLPISFSGGHHLKPRCGDIRPLKSQTPG
jgi:O-antigen ligase